MKSILSMVIGASLACCAIEASAEEPTFQKVQLDIARQSLNDALNAWAEQTGFQLVCLAPEVARDLLAPKVKGAFTATGALEQLLSGTPLVYEFTSERMVTVRARFTAASQTTGAVEKVEVPRLQIAALGPAEERSGSAKESETGATRAAASRDNSIKADVEELEEIVVTGSHIRGATASSAAVKTYTRDEIASTGAATVAQFLDKLPQNFAGDSSDTTFFGNTNNDAESATAVNLRGVGTSGTLVLLNGRRLAPAAMGEFVDISSIPLAAVERVDVLTDGASAIYGSDAIAGVVNFILRKEFDGAETHIRFGKFANSDAQATSASQAFGGSWDSGNVLLSGTYEKQDPILASDREYVGVPDPFYLSPRSESGGALLSVSQHASSNVQLSFDGLYSKREITDTKTLDFLPTYQYRTEVSQYSAAGGVIVGLPSDWSAELFVSDARNERDSTFDFVGTLTPSFYEGHVTNVDLKTDGALFQGTGGKVSVAVGASYRKERYQSGDEGLQAFGFAKGRFNRDVRAAFSEISVPIVGPQNAFSGVRSLSISLAARYEDYTDAGNTFDPKFGVLWQISPELDLRASYSTSFNTAKYFDTITSFNVFTIRNIESTACTDGECLVLIEQGAKTEYEPETSRSYTIGLDYRPQWATGLSVSIGYYDIRYEDRLGLPPPSAVVLDQRSAFPSLVTPSPSEALVQDFVDRGSQYVNFINQVGSFDPASVDYYLDLRTTNLALTKTNGLDFDLRYAIEAAGSRWNFGIEATYVFELSHRITPISELNETIDTIANPLSTRARGSIIYSRNGFSIGAFVNYTGSYENNNFLPEQAIESWTTVDLRASVPTDRWIKAFESGSEIALSIQNATNSDPPTALSPIFPIGFDPANANPNGRVVSLDFLARW